MNDRKVPPTEEDFEARLEGVCVKWVADEAETLTEASLMLRDYAEWLLELELDGWQLVDPVDGGHGMMVNEDPEKRVSERAEPAARHSLTNLSDWRDG
jgi:hypothetical protein